MAIIWISISHLESFGAPVFPAWSFGMRLTCLLRQASRDILTSELNGGNMQSTNKNRIVQQNETNEVHWMNAIAINGQINRKGKGAEIDIKIRKCSTFHNQAKGRLWLGVCNLKKKNELKEGFAWKVGIKRSEREKEREKKEKVEMVEIGK